MKLKNQAKITFSLNHSTNEKKWLKLKADYHGQNCHFSMFRNLQKPSVTLDKFAKIPKLLIIFVNELTKFRVAR